MMPTPVYLNATEVYELKKRAKHEMQSGREDVRKQIARSAERSWDYGEGKKTALKVGVGLGVGTGIAAIGVATHGLGIPVIAGVAAGGFVTGQLSDTMITKAWGREYTGGTRTREWLGHGPPVIDTFARSKVAEERAHKTLRRAFQHYRTAQEKVGQWKRKSWQWRIPNKLETCEEAFNWMTDLVHVKRHLDKARLYLLPAVFLSQYILTDCDDKWGRWSKKGDVTKKWHPATVCADYFKNPQLCAWMGPNNRSAGLPLPPGQWLSTFNVQSEKQKLIILLGQLGSDPTLLLQYAKQSSWGTKKMFEDAERDCNEHRAAAKVKHGITNPLQRMTTGEQAGFAVKKIGSMGLAGATMGAQIPAEAIHGISVLIDEGFSAVDLGIGEGFNGIVNSLQATEPQDAQEGADTQESIRKAAIHLWEADEAIGAIYATNNNSHDFNGHTCCEAVEYLRQVYKIEHHLRKSQTYIHETVETIRRLADAVDTALRSLTKASNLVFDSVDQFLLNHPGCTAGRCYSSNNYTSYAFR